MFNKLSDLKFFCVKISLDVVTQPEPKSQITKIVLK